MGYIHFHHWPSASSVTPSWSFSSGCHPGSSESFVSPPRPGRLPVTLRCPSLLPVLPLRLLQPHLLPPRPAWWSGGCDCGGVRLDIRFRGSSRPDLPRHHGDTGGAERPSAAKSLLSPGSDRLSEIRGPEKEKKVTINHLTKLHHRNQKIKKSLHSQSVIKLGPTHL